MRTRPRAVPGATLQFVPHWSNNSDCVWSLSRCRPKSSWWMKQNSLPATSGDLMQKKLDPESVKRIRQLYQTGQYKQQYLALVYQVSSAQISRIVNFKRRKGD